MINQILQIKLKRYYEAKSFEHFISSTLSFFDIINLLSIIQKKEIVIKDFNKNWQFLHSEIFEEVFNNITKDMKPEISKRDFNVKFKIEYEEDSRVKICKKNINEVIQLTLPLLISYLNIEPKLKILTEDVKGDIGVRSSDL